MAFKLSVGALEGYSTVSQFCEDRHYTQGFVCAIGDCMMADSVAALQVEASERVEPNADVLVKQGIEAANTYLEATGLDFRIPMPVQLEAL